MFKLIFFLISNSLCFADVNVDQILDKMDKLYKSDTSYALLEMTIETPEWERLMRMKSWTQGLENTFITILYPSKDKGISTLKKGNEMWNYFPKINKVIKIPPSMMMGSWMGSDFTNDDLVKENTYRNDHTSTLLESTDDYYLIELIPKKETVTVWGKIHLKVEKRRTVPLEEIFFNEKGEKVRLMKFGDVKKVDEKELPMKMELIPLTKKGHRTIVEYKEISFGVKIPTNTFSKENLKKRR